MYNTNHRIEHVFMLHEFRQIPKARLTCFVQAPEKVMLAEWANTLKGKFNGQQLKWKKPYIMIFNPIKRHYEIWTENYMTRM